MKERKEYRITLLLVILALLFSFSNVQAAETPSFIVVLDAGHGGHDPGAVNGTNYEKTINLGITLALGKLIEKNHPDVKIVYTRKTDVYLTLQERADVANNAKADLFICIHTNANNSPVPSGTETYILGLTKSKSNLDVAMRENSVILLEDDYKVKYAGFNPNSADSYIMFECIQDRYLDKSLQVATDLQQSFASIGRVDKGVRQAGFWVLHKTAMPSVLIEVGYISNKEEMKFLVSQEGQTKMANAIFTSFENFKKEYQRKSGKQSITSPVVDSPTAQNKPETKSDENSGLKNKETKPEKPADEPKQTAEIANQEELSQQFLDKMKAEAKVDDKKVGTPAKPANNPISEPKKPEPKIEPIVDLTQKKPVVETAKAPTTPTGSKVEAKKPEPITPSPSATPKQEEKPAVTSTPSKPVTAVAPKPEQKKPEAITTSTPSKKTETTTIASSAPKQEVKPSVTSTPSMASTPAKPVTAVAPKSEPKKPEPTTASTPSKKPEANAITPSTSKQELKPTAATTSVKSSTVVAPKSDPKKVEPINPSSQAKKTETPAVSSSTPKMENKLPVAKPTASSTVTSTPAKKTEPPVALTPKPVVPEKFESVASVTTYQSAKTQVAPAPKAEVKPEIKAEPKQKVKAVVKQEPVIKVEPKKPEAVSQPKSTQSNDAVVYKLQLFALSKVQPQNNPAFKGLKVDYFEEAGLYKYTYGSTASYDEIVKMKKEIAGKFPNAMIIAMKNGKKVPIPASSK